METTLNGAFQELFSKVDPYIKEDPTRIDKYFWNCSSANLSMNKRKDLLRNIIYKYEHKIFLYRIVTMSDFKTLVLFYKHD